MKQIAIFGATGCVASALIEKLLAAGSRQIIASCRPGISDQNKLLQHERLIWRQLDLLNPESAASFAAGAEIAVYLIHSLDKRDFQNLDKKLALAAGLACQKAGVKKIIYLGGITPSHQKLSAHLQSRSETGLALASSGLPVAEVRASILLGRCSVSFQMIYALAKHCRVIFAPKGINSLCSPIALEDACDFLAALVDKKIQGHEIFEIGAETISYKDLIDRCSRAISGRNKIIIPIPLLPVGVFSWLFGLFPEIDGRVAMALAKSLKNNSNFTNNRFREISGREPKPINEVLKSMAAP